MRGGKPVGKSFADLKVFFCFSTTIKRNPSDSNGSTSHPSVGSILCFQEFTVSNGGDVVTGTAEGHRVFATPPCKGQRRLTMVVAAETLPFVVGGSFLCEREELRS